MKNRAKKRMGQSENLPEEVRSRLSQAADDIERDLGKIDMLFPDERAEMEEGLKDLRKILNAPEAEVEIVPAKHRLH